MDPLSITASVITLVQATAGIGKGIRFLRSLAQIPAEFRDLVDELATLQTVINHVEVSLRELESTTTSSSSKLYSWGIDPGIIISLKNDLAQITRELEALCDRLKKSGPRPALKSEDRQDHERVSKYKWQKEKANIATLHHKARTTREYLGLCLSVFSSSQTQVARLTTPGPIHYSS
jgi:septal ring factor EnvC (AmiA/AmiB activator)